jgi:hypothetical protein
MFSAACIKKFDDTKRVIGIRYLINGWSVAERIAETGNTSGAHGFT